MTEDELIKLSATLDENKKLWGGVKFIGNLPCTINGKVDKKVLKEMAKNLKQDS